MNINGIFVELDNYNLILVKGPQNVLNVVKVNVFNHIIHPHRYAYSKALLNRCKAVDDMQLINNYKVRIECTKSLTVLLTIHKEIWQDGFRTTALTNKVYFRKPVPKLTADDVYLGNIYGLWTKSITDWSTRFRNETYDANNFGINPDTRLYDIMVLQYKQILLDALKEFNKAINNTLKIID